MILQSFILLHHKLSLTKQSTYLSSHEIQQPFCNQKPPVPHFTKLTYPETFPQQTNFNQLYGSPAMHHESMSLSHGWWTMDLSTLTTPTTFPTQEMISLLVLDRPEPVAAHYVTSVGSDQY